MAWAASTSRAVRAFQARARVRFCAGPLLLFTCRMVFELFVLFEVCDKFPNYRFNSSSKLPRARRSVSRD
jgi:hypothetical protein